jgi:hypothetical protein
MVACSELDTALLVATSTPLLEATDDDVAFAATSVLASDEVPRTLLPVSSPLCVVVPPPLVVSCAQLDAVWLTVPSALLLGCTDCVMVALDPSADVWPEVCSDVADPLPVAVVSGPALAVSAVSPVAFSDNPLDHAGNAAPVLLAASASLVKGPVVSAVLMPSVDVE